MFGVTPGENSEDLESWSGQCWDNTGSGLGSLGQSGSKSGRYWGNTCLDRASAGITLGQGSEHLP